MGTMTPPAAAQPQEASGNASGRSTWNHPLSLVLGAVALLGVGFLAGRRTAPATSGIISAPAEDTSIAQPAPAKVAALGVPERLLAADEILKKHLKAPSTYRRVAATLFWANENEPGSRSFVFRVEYDAQNSYGALLRGCAFVPVSEWRDMGIYSAPVDCEHGDLMDRTALVNALLSPGPKS